jgi:2-oxoglutarate dehydrogenase complex dehydrogenase (E1) component-like enzyme
MFSVVWIFGIKESMKKLPMYGNFAFVLYSIFRYAGRHTSAATATGNKQMHTMEHGQFMKQALSLITG